MKLSITHIVGVISLSKLALSIQILLCDHDQPAARVDQTKACADDFWTHSSDLIEVTGTAPIYAQTVCSTFEITDDESYPSTSILVWTDWTPQGSAPQGGRRTVSSSDIACGMQKVLDACQFDGGQVGGTATVCGTEDTYVIVRG